MRTWWMIGGGSVVTGVLIGAGIVSYLHAHRPEPTTASRDETVALDQTEAGGNEPAASPTPLPLRTDSDKDGGSGGDVLSVGQPVPQGSAQQSTGQAAGGPARLPEPDEFEIYEQYTSSAQAMFQDVKVGDGSEAATGKTAVVHYRGWLTDGRKFDESYARGQPFSFAVGSGQVIRGWDQGIPGMKIGGKRRLIVPPEAGYGDRDHNGIPANSLLVFDVELLEVK